MLQCMKMLIFGHFYLQHNLRQWFSTEGHFTPTPGDIWQCLETFLIVTDGRQWWEEARDAVKYPMIHRTAPTAKNYLAPNSSSTKVEKSSSNTNPPNPHDSPVRQELFMPI